MLDLSELVDDHLDQATRQKSVKRGTHHWSCNVPTLLVWMDSASTSSELLSETGSIADSDFTEVDLGLAAVTAPTQVVEVSVHSEGSVEAAIDASQAPTMDNVFPVPLCAELINLCACATSGLYIQSAFPD